jgi:hypothetical protein
MARRTRGTRGFRILEVEPSRVAIILHPKASNVDLTRTNAALDAMMKTMKSQVTEVCWDRAAGEGSERSFTPA